MTDQPGLWLAATVLSIEETRIVNHAMHARWVRQSTLPPPLAADDGGWADIFAAGHVALEKHRQTLSAEAGLETEIDRLRWALSSIADTTHRQQLPITAQIYAVATDALYGQALAAAARQGGDVKQAPAESPQSGHEVVTPNPCPVGKGVS